MLMAGRRRAAGQGVPGESLDLLLNIAMNLELLLVFPGGSDGKGSACNAGEAGSIPGSGRSPGEANPTPGFLSGEFHGQRSLVGSGPGGRKELDKAE